MVLLVVVCEVAFLSCFFSLDLPNGDIPGRPGQKYSRLMVWQLSVPGLVPDVPCLAWQALGRLSDWRNLAQRLPIVGYGLVILAAAVAVGWGLVALLGLDDGPSTGRVGKEGLELRSGARRRGSGRGDAGSQPAGSSAPKAADAEQTMRLYATERLVLAYGLGLSALSLSTLVLGLAGWLNRWVVLAGLVVVVAVAAVLLCRSRSRRTERLFGSSGDKRLAPARLSGSLPSVPFAFGLVAAALFLCISLLGAMLPATDFDVREYHLQGPKEFYLAGRIWFAPHNVYTNMPFGTEMLTLLGMVLAGDWWWGALVGQLVLATFGPLTALGVFAAGRRLFGPAAGALGALVYLTTPWVYRISIIPYAENALCFFLLAAVLSVILGVRVPQRRVPFWLAAGLLAGSAAACKYTALTSTVLPLVVAAAVWPLAERRWSWLSAQRDDRAACRSPLRWAWQPAAAFCLGAVVACGPWLVKNAVVTGNPTYPLLYRVFGGRNWTAAKDRKWEWGHRVPLLVQLGLQRPPPGVQLDPNDPQHGVTLSLLWRNLTDVVARADWQSPLLFGFAPLALLRRRGRAAAACLWLLVGYLFFQWWLLTHRIDRFWLPLLPPAALLAGAGLLWSRDRLWQWFATAAVALVIFYNFSYATTGLCGYNHYTARLDPMRADPTNEFVNYMNRTLARDARVLAVGAADLFHLRRSVVYNTVFDDCIFERIARGRTPGQVAAELRRAGITHIYVSWAEVARYRATYGFSDFVRPRLFRHLCTAQPPVLRRLTAAGPSVDVAGESAPASELYEVIGHEGLRL